MSDWDYFVKPCRTIWQEDCCAPDAERIGEARQRLFGEPLDTSRAIGKIDGGDAIAYLMPGRRVAIINYPGNTEIRVLPEVQNPC